MSGELEKNPTSFQAAVERIYGNQLVPRSHAADNLYAKAADILMYQGVRAKLPSGARAWVSGGSFQSQAGNLDVLYSLMTERKRFDLKCNKKIAQQVINLTINVADRPVAIMLPPKDSETSAAIVVGEDVNVPEQLAEIESIVDGVRSVSPYRDIDFY